MNAIRYSLLAAAISATLSPITAQIWTTYPAPALSWASVASSADGSRLAAVAFTGPVYTSANSGVDWVTNASPTAGWKSIASSADGMILLACPQSGSSQLSTDGGDTWQYAGRTGNYGAMSADGSFLALRSDSLFFISTNMGANWQTIQTPNKSWRCIACTTNGQKLVTAGTLGAIYTSLDFGVTWTSNSVPGEVWSAAAISADGNIAAVVAGMKNGPKGPILVSTNAFASWFQANAPVSNWVAVATSADATRMYALTAADAPNGPNSIFTSTNFGVDWHVMPGPNAWWSGIALSADGGKAVAVASQANGVFATQSTIAPRLTASATSGLQLSWLIPSADFVLQENSDLTTTNWSDVTNAIATNFTNLQHQVTLPTAANGAFYRLRTP